MKRVLVVAYYFPPMGLSGVQRVAKFVKYLPEHGWLPTVLTVEPGGYFAYDAALLAEVEAAGVEICRTRSFDPTRLFGRRQTVQLPAESRRRLLSELSQFFFIPDNKIGWYGPAVRAGRRLLAERRFDAVFSSAPPYTAHLIAARLSALGQLPLVTDFRDDWVGNPRHVYPTRLHHRLQQALERLVIRRSRRVYTINEPIRRALIERNTAAGEEPDVRLLYQGFDPADFERADFERADSPASKEPGRMRLLYSGIFYDAQRPDDFLRGLAAWLEEEPAARGAVEAVFVGMLPEAAHGLVERLGLQDVVRHVGYVSHEEAVVYLCSADVLWMTIGRREGAEGISTSKLFEYMGTRKPILALVPAGAAAAALGPYGAAVMASPDDVGQIKARLAALYADWKAGRLPVGRADYVRRFDRRQLAGALAAALEAVSRTGPSGRE